MGNACPPSQGITLTDTLPAGTTVVAASGGPTVRGNLLTFAVPDLSAGGSASFTLTVLPGSAGPFTEQAAVSTHDDPNPANNTATLTLTVLAPFPTTGFADMTSLVQLAPLGRRRPRRQLLCRLTNISRTPLQGPIGVTNWARRMRPGRTSPAAAPFRGIVKPAPVTLTGTHRGAHAVL